jgi:hypothetical protein
MPLGNSGTNLMLMRGRIDGFLRLPAGGVKAGRPITRENSAQSDASRAFGDVNPCRLKLYLQLTQRLHLLNDCVRVDSVLGQQFLGFA